MNDYDRVRAQKIFDKIATHLAHQGKRSIAYVDDDGFGSCVYRGPNGMQCAMGCMIPDEEYNPGDEGKDVHSLLEIENVDPVDRPILYSLRPYKDLLCELQGDHDAADSDISDHADRGKTIVQRLYATAFNHQLSPKILDTLTFPEVWK